VDDAKAFEVVEPVFRRIFAAVWKDGSESAAALDSISEGERAIYATRILEAELDNGGWYQVFFNHVDGLIEHAIAGYVLLGLPEYAAHLREVRAKGFDGDAPEQLGDLLDNAYFRLSGSEVARAALVQEFGGDDRIRTGE
jgi:hypothetical protein